jgi:hypothetical protein
MLSDVEDMAQGVLAAAPLILPIFRIGVYYLIEAFGPVGHEDTSENALGRCTGAASRSIGGVA